MHGGVWDIVVADKTTFKPLGDITQVTNFGYARSLSKLATTSFTIPLSNQFVNQIAAGAVNIKLYREGVLKFHGPVISAEQTAEREALSLAVNCADAGWILTKRLAGKSTTGRQFTSATNLATIAKTLIDEEAALAAMPISTTTVALTAGSARTYVAGPYKPILDCVTELGSALDGFDWRFVPIENWVNGASSGSSINYFDAQTLIGANKPTAIFEYGPDTRANMLNWSISLDRATQATRVYQIASNNALAVVTGINATAETAWGRLEDVVSADLLDQTMRQQIVDEHAAVRGTPRTIVKITPHIDPGTPGRVPEPFVDYDAGDTITGRIVVDGQIRFSGLLRVYGISASVDDQGFERVELVTEDES